MHGHINEAEFLAGISGFLGGYYVALAIINGLWALWLWTQLQRTGEALVWAALAVVLTAISSVAFGGNPQAMAWIALPSAVKSVANLAFASATFYTLASLAFLVVAFLTRRWWVQPTVAWSIFNFSAILMGFAMCDYNFADIVRKVVLPGALPTILAGFRISSSIALLLVVSAEMVGAEKGIGAFVLQAGNLMQTDQLLAGVLVLSLLGLAVARAIAALERRFIDWR